MVAAPLNPFDMGHQGRPCDAGITFGRASQSALTPIRSPTPFTYAYGDQARTRTVLPHVDCAVQLVAHQRCMYGPVAGDGYAWIATRAGLLGLSRQGECTARDRCRSADVLVRVACGLSFCHVSTPTAHRHGVQQVISSSRGGDEDGGRQKWASDAGTGRSGMRGN